MDFTVGSAVIELNNRVEFFHLLPTLGFPAVLYDAEELAHDLATLESLRLDEAARPSEDRSGA